MEPGWHRKSEAERRSQAEAAARAMALTGEVERLQTALHHWTVECEGGAQLGTTLEGWARSQRPVCQPRSPDMRLSSSSVAIDLGLRQLIGVSLPPFLSF